MNALKDIDKVVVALGNPEPDYKKWTRHNAGKLAAEELVKKYSGTFAYREDLLAEIAVITINSVKTLLCLPTTGMNDSGLAVANILQATSVAADNFLLAYDALELESQAVELTTKKVNSLPPHNGLRSVVSNLPQDSQWKRFARLKIRVGKDPGRDARYHYLVEDELTGIERELFALDVQEALTQMERWVSEHTAHAM